VSLDAEVSVSLGPFEEKLHLHVADGEVVAVLGPNGSGKSTLLRALAGLQPLSGGRIVLDGQVLDDPEAGILVPPEARPCGMVFQDFLLFPHLSALANVAFGLRSRGRSKAEANRGALEWLVRMELGDVGASRPAKLSGGQAQRVAVARALAIEPRLLLLDEPMAALDVTTRGSVRHQLRAHLASFEGSCILVTHDPLDAAAIADRLVIVEGGTIVQEGTLGDVTARPRSAYVAELMGVNLLRGRGAGTSLRLADGSRLETAHPSLGDTFAVIRANGVTLHTGAPGDRLGNTWSTQVVAIHLLGDRARVQLGDPIRLAAEVTAAGLGELGLTEGAPVWASVDAARIEVYPVDSRQT
jgi:molybdate transport system ATP-binding protein